MQHNLVVFILMSLKAEPAAAELSYELKRCKENLLKFYKNLRAAVHLIKNFNELFTFLIIDHIMTKRC